MWHVGECASVLLVPSRRPLQCLTQHRCCMWLILTTSFASCCCCCTPPPPTRPWQLLDDGYSFDLQTRPPTQTLDLLTSYLEVKYADVLLQKDAVQTINRQLALQTLRNQAGGGFASEVLEQPPAALTAAKTLSPSEREAVSKTLDSLLGSKQYGRYREAVLQLYCDGLVSWGQLQECWAAAQAGEELTAAAEAPVKFAGEGTVSCAVCFVCVRVSVLGLLLLLLCGWGGVNPF